MKSWRHTQLSDKNCEQDQLILNLFKSSAVRYVGHDREFSKRLTVNDDAENLVLIINKNFWLSDLIDCIQKNCDYKTKSFYIGINRYCLQGNDTTLAVNQYNSMGLTIINFVSELLSNQGFTVEQSGHYDHDRGRNFNFIQPLTWVYGTNHRN